jgi:anaerobic selenocysteine-containing dehydrogenase
MSTAMTKEAVLGSWRRDAIILALGSTAAVATIMLLAMLLGKIHKMKASRPSVCGSTSPHSRVSRPSSKLVHRASGAVGIAFPNLIEDRP